MTEKKIHTPLTFVQLVITGIAAGFLMVVLFTSPVSRAPLSSAETRFVENSQHGLGIVPASCASNPGYYHSHLYTAPGNTRAFVSHTGETEYGASLAGDTYYICVTNTSGNAYFIPANTIGEAASFKSATIPGVSKW